MEPLTPDHVQAALHALHLDITIGCEVGQIAKSLCFVVEDHPILVIASGDQRVDDRKLAALLGVPRKQVKFATPAQYIEHWGYAPGGVAACRASPPAGRGVPRPRAATLHRDLSGGWCQ